MTIILIFFIYINYKYLCICGTRSRCDLWIMCPCLRLVSSSRDKTLRVWSQERYILLLTIYKQRFFMNWFVLLLPRVETFSLLFFGFCQQNSFVCDFFLNTLGFLTCTFFFFFRLPILNNCSFVYLRLSLHNYFCQSYCLFIFVY